MPNPEFEIQGTSITPPGGWKYTHENPHFVAQHYDYGAWLKQVQGFFEGNDIVMTPDWVEQLHSESCKQNPQWGSFCKHWTGRKLERRPVNFAVVMQFLKMLLKWVSKGGQLVDQEEAELRAEICSRCPYNYPSAQGCGSCMSQILGLIEKLIGKKDNKHSASLGSCGLCSCNLNAAIWFPLEAQNSSLTEEIKAQFKQTPYCWKGQE